MSNPVDDDALRVVLSNESMLDAVRALVREGVPLRPYLTSIGSIDENDPDRTVEVSEAGGIMSQAVRGYELAGVRVDERVPQWADLVGDAVFSLPDASAERLARALRAIRGEPEVLSAVRAMCASGLTWVTVREYLLSIGVIDPSGKPMG